MTSQSRRIKVNGLKWFIFQGVLVERPIVYGSHAYPLLKKDANIDQSHTHQWTVFVRGAGDSDISPIVKKVVFKLHDSFAQPSRSNDLSHS
jgi:transcription initiation factor IIF auxiliary subunit